jgi:hypothetical protein
MQALIGLIAALFCFIALAIGHFGLATISVLVIVACFQYSERSL